MAWFLILALLLPNNVTKLQLLCRKRMGLPQSINLRITCDNACRGLSEMSNMLEVLTIVHFYCRILFALSQITPIWRFWNKLFSDFRNRESCIFRGIYHSMWAMWILILCLNINESLLGPLGCSEAKLCFTSSKWKHCGFHSHLIIKILPSIFWIFVQLIRPKTIYSKYLPFFPF